MSDMVKSPKHYASILGEKLGIEVIDVSNALGLNGNRFSMLKYLCRAGIKDPAKEVEDLEKIIQYATFEIRRLKDEPVSDTRRSKSEHANYNVLGYTPNPFKESFPQGPAAQHIDGAREKIAEDVTYTGDGKKSQAADVYCYVLNVETQDIFGPFTENGLARQYMRTHNLSGKTYAVISGIVPPESPLHPMHAPKHMPPR